jgi:hypothetical protein
MGIRISRPCSLEVGLLVMSSGELVCDCRVSIIDGVGTHLEFNLVEPITPSRPDNRPGWGALSSAGNTLPSVLCERYAGPRSTDRGDQDFLNSCCRIRYRIVPARSSNMPMYDKDHNQNDGRSNGENDDQRS